MIKADSLSLWLKIKIPIGSDYTYDYKRINKIAYGIHPSQTIIPYHSGLYPRINIMPGADPKLIKDMFKYGFLNLVYVSDDCKEIKKLLAKVVEAATNLKMISQTKDIDFIKILTACPEYCGSRWYPAQHMIQVGISSKKVSPTVDLDQVYNDYDPKLFEPKALTSKRVIGMKVLYESLERMSKEKIWLHEATKEHLIFSMSRKENILPRQAILKKKKGIYENLVESSLPTHHEVCKVLKHQLSCGYCYEGSKGDFSGEDMSPDEDLIIGMRWGPLQKIKDAIQKASIIQKEKTHQIKVVCQHEKRTTSAFNDEDGGSPYQKEIENLPQESNMCYVT